jgi:membrane associated rhomboid family serine protease
MGSPRFALLFVAGALFGDLAFWLVHVSTKSSAIGASSGISAAIVYYALTMRGARLSLFQRTGRWITLPAYSAVIMWLLVQVAGASKELAGLGRVAYVAHLGGASVGVLAWLLSSRTDPLNAAAQSDARPE